MRSNKYLDIKNFEDYLEQKKDFLDEQMSNFLRYQRMLNVTMEDDNEINSSKMQTNIKVNMNITKIEGPDMLSI